MVRQKKDNVFREIMDKVYRKKPWNRGVTAIAAVIVFITTYLLILPAITMTKDIVCGKEEHIHNDQCYETTYQRVLNCPYTQVGGVIILHKHDGNCYDTEGRLICPLQEIEEHVHTAACFGVEEQDLFGSTAVYDGFGTADAFTSAEEDFGIYEGTDLFSSSTAAVPLCGKGEVTPHVHAEECYDVYGNLICGKPEVIAHQHGEECYSFVPDRRILICGREEHVHDDSCYASKGEELPEEVGAVEDFFTGEISEDIAVIDGIGASDDFATDPEEMFGSEIAEENTDIIPEGNKNDEDNNSLTFFIGTGGEEAFELAAAGEDLFSSGESDDQEPGFDSGSDGGAALPAEIEGENVAEVPGKTENGNEFEESFGESTTVEETTELSVAETTTEITTEAFVLVLDEDREALAEKEGENETDAGEDAEQGESDDAGEEIAEADEVETTVEPITEIISEIEYTISEQTTELQTEDTSVAQSAEETTGEPLNERTAEITTEEVSVERPEQVTTEATMVEQSTEITTEWTAIESMTAQTTEGMAESTTSETLTEQTTEGMTEWTTFEQMAEQTTEGMTEWTTFEQMAEQTTEDTTEWTTFEPVSEFTTERVTEWTTFEPSTEITTEWTTVETSTEQTTEWIQTTEYVEPTTAVLEYIGSDYKVRVTYLPASGIPAGARVEAEEIAYDSDEYAEYLTQAKSALGLDESKDLPKEYARFFDIQIMAAGEDGEWKEIEPTGPVRVEIIYDQPVNVEGADTAAANIVHFDEQEEETKVEVLATIDATSNGENSEEANHVADTGVNEAENSQGGNNAGEAENGVTEDTETLVLPEANVAVETSIPGTTDEAEEEGTSEGKKTEDTKNTIAFEANSFSVYGVIYTVDFHWEVDGRMYEFSLPGGGFISFSDLIEVLGVAKTGENDDINLPGEVPSIDNQDENSPESAENTGVQLPMEVSGIENQDGTALTLDDVVVSEDTWEFVADVESVIFSSPELVWVGKVDEESTVGGIKESRGLEVQYSAELTEEQIEEINSTVVESGDWALISMLPFESTESLTVTMKTGEVFEIRVTDYQLKKTVIDAKGDTWEITVTYDDSAEIPKDAELEVSEILRENEKYAEYYQKAMEKAAGSEVAVSDNYARFFDIEIHADGQKIEPKALVTVKIELADAPEEEKLAVVHFEATRSDDITVPVLMDVEVGEDILFETESFSVYGVITVPEAQPDPAVTDLDGKSFTISHDSRYVTTNITPIENNNNTNGFGKTTSVSQAATWFFEQPEDTSGNTYYIYTLVNDQKKYLNLTKNYNNTDRANASLSGNPQTFTVTNEGNSYRLSTQSDGTTYYLDEHNGNSGNAFAGWHGATNNGLLTLNFSSQPVMQNNGQYMTLVKYADKYYIVNNDGSLTEVKYDDATKTVEVDDPMLWNVNQNNPNGHIWFNSKETGFEWRQTASDWYRRYLDPSVSGAITEENANNVDVQYDYTNQDGSIANHINRNGNKTRALESQTAVNIYNDPNDDKDTYKIYHGAWDAGQNYLGVELDENGVPIRLVGQKDISDAAEFVFASPTAVKAPNHLTHTVDHIDVSIEGSANVSIPLAYGNYYGENGDSEDPIKVVTSNTKLELSKAQMVDPSQLKITSEDMKRATITAVRADNGENLNDAFYITGFSGNVHTSLSADQVRIEGSFLVADLRGTEYETIDGGRYSQNTTYRNNVRTARLNNKVEYTVTVVKPLTYNLIDPELGQLYDEDGNAITVTVDVAFSASFNYWDNGNECPAVHYASTDGEAAWRAGGVDSSNLSGMDFVLGGDAENPDSPLVALEITKVIMDEEGNRIELSTPVTNYFDIYEKRNASNDEKNGVTGLHVVDSLNHPDWQSDSRDSTLHDGYTYWRTKRLTVDDTGSAIVFDFNATDAMYYIVEKHDEDSLPETVTDKSGAEWTYVKTYIETEYVRRDDDDGSHDEYSNKTLHPKAMHITEEFIRDNGSYASIPEVAGNFIKLNGEHKKEGFLEFYVYNIYEKLGSLKLTKIALDNGNTPTTAEQKQHVDGDYKFKITSAEGVTPTVTKYVQITVSDGVASSYKIADSEEGLSSAQSQNGVSAVITGLSEGDYTIEEINKNGLMLIGLSRADNSTSAVDNENGKVTVHVTAGDTDASQSSAQATITNSYYDTDGPDKITLDIVKTFSGITSVDEIPSDFEVVVGYSLSGSEKTISLKKGQNETNADGIKIVETTSGLTLSWHITNVPSEATGFKIKEVKYDSVSGYDFTAATLNGTDITETAGDWHTITVTAPTAQLHKVTDLRNTSDSPSELKYILEDGDILLSKLTGNEGTLVISKKSLNTVVRQAVINGWPSQGGFKKHHIYWFSIEEHPEGFGYGGKTVTFGTNSEGKTVVTFTSSVAAQEDVFEVSYESNAVLNNASLTNVYVQKTVDLDIVKEDENNTTTKLPNAKFTIRKIKDKLGGNGIEYDGDESDPVITDANGEAGFKGLTQGYYEIKETKTPDGYVITGDGCFYIKVDDGVIYLLEKTAGSDPKNWNATKTVVGNVTFTAAQAAVADDPETDEDETVVATNAIFTVKNTPGAALPNTGGPGTNLIYLLGMILTAVGCCGIVMMRKRRVRSR
ncbi:MAG: hypothetical protein IJ899_22470 [Blautia sp.]|nr:hypothetical protein [Blautia sp.]